MSAGRVRAGPHRASRSPPLRTPSLPSSYTAAATSQPYLSGDRGPLKREREHEHPKYPRPVHRRRRYSDSDSWTRVLESEPPYPYTTTFLPEYTFRLNINPRQPLASKGWKPSPFPIASCVRQAPAVPSHPHPVPSRAGGPKLDRKSVV